MPEGKYAILCSESNVELAEQINALDRFLSHMRG